MVIDKQWLRERFAEMDAADGFVLDPTATAQKARAMMLADGVRPENNEASREILYRRYPEDYTDWQSRRPGRSSRP
ncbi:MAG: hypothetical protein M3Y28_09815 [Armatimonadota bacterium]|nr:hypothetical protein [Armatimonadota bacterium]